MTDEEEIDDRMTRLEKAESQKPERAIKDGNRLFYTQSYRHEPVNKTCTGDIYYTVNRRQCVGDMTFTFRRATQRV